MTKSVPREDLSTGDRVRVRVDRVSGSGNPIAADGVLHVDGGYDYVGEDVVVEVTDTRGHIQTDLVEAADPEDVPRYRPDRSTTTRQEDPDWKGENKNKLLNGHL